VQASAPLGRITACSQKCPTLVQGRGRGICHRRQAVGEGEVAQLLLAYPSGEATFRGGDSRLIITRRLICETAQSTAIASSQSAPSSANGKCVRLWSFLGSGDRPVGVNRFLDGQAAGKPLWPVIPRSRRRRGILHCLENNQGEIPRFARNDSLEAFLGSLSVLVGRHPSAAGCCLIPSRGRKKWAFGFTSEPVETRRLNSTTKRCDTFRCLGSRVA
jgi:hypothetical protein